MSKFQFCEASDLDTFVKYSQQMTFCLFEKGSQKVFDTGGIFGHVKFDL